MNSLVVLALAVAVASGASVPRSQPPQRIVGGTATTIDQYPSMVALLYNDDGWMPYTQWCGASILTSRTLLTAAHCFERNMVVHSTDWWKARVGSTMANSGGSVYDIDRFFLHDDYNSNRNFHADIAILRTATAIAYVDNAVAPGVIAGSTYNIPDNAVVWATGWGLQSEWDWQSPEQLRHVQIWTINQAECRSRYSTITDVTDGMLCSGWLDVGGRDQCSGDSGGPLYHPVGHQYVIAGVCSFGRGCASSRYPGVNSRVSAFSDWIVATAQNA